MRRTVLAAIAAVTLMSVTWLGPPAARAQDTVALTSAVVLAKGAVIRLAFAVRCDPGFHADITVVLRQRTGHARTTASSGVPVDCTGLPQDVSLLLVPPPGQPAFSRRPVQVSGVLANCEGPGDCYKATRFELRTGLGRHLPPPAPTENPDRVRLDSATVVPDGSVRLALDVSCRADNVGASISVLVAQEVGRTVAQARAFARVDCGGAGPVVVDLVVEPGQRTFRRGTAFVSAALHNTLDPGSSEVTTLQQTVRLRRSCS